MFRSKAIKAARFFKRAMHFIKEDSVTPDFHIKVEVDEDKIKSEPLDDDPNYEFMQSIDSMIQHPGAPGTSFVDVLRNVDHFMGEKNNSERRPSRRHAEDFGSSSGVVRCHLCMKTFTSVSSHQNHMKTVHRKMSVSEMHQCKHCNRYFKLKIYLNRHIARIHGTSSSRGRCDSRKKASETIFNKEDVSLYCEVSCCRKRMFNYD